MIAVRKHTNTISGMFHFPGGFVARIVRVPCQTGITRLNTAAVQVMRAAFLISLNQGVSNRVPDVGWSITSKVIEMSAIRLLWNTDGPHSLSALYFYSCPSFHSSYHA